MARLLLADDSVTIQRVIEMTFAAEDITVTAVSDGEQAMARIAQDHFDIVLADIAMPKRNGYEVAEFVKSRPDLASIPVLLLAGAFEPVDQQRAEQVKCDGVLVKPFEPQQVIARVRELIAGARGTPAAAASGVPRPVERLTGPFKLVESRRERATEPASAPAATHAPLETSTAPPATREAPEPQVAPAARHAEPVVPARSERTVAVGVDRVLDDYFDRLDAAFANLSANSLTDSAPASRGTLPSAAPPLPVAAPPQPAETRVDEPSPVPTIASLLAKNSSAATSAREPSLPSPAAPAVPGSPLVAAPVIEPADTHLDTPAAPAKTSDSAPAQAEPVSLPSLADAFSALLAAELGEKPAPDLSALRPAPRAPVVDEALVESITRRVIAQLAPDLVRRTVTDLVSDTAERLVREEIARIKESK